MNKCGELEIYTNVQAKPIIHWGNAMKCLFCALTEYCTAVDRSLYNVNICSDSQNELLYHHLICLMSFFRCYSFFVIFFPSVFPIAPLAITMQRKRTMPETGMATGNHSSKLYTLNFSWPVNLMWWLQTVAFERFLSHDFYTKDMQSLHQNGNFVILNIKRYRDRQSAIGRSQVAISCLVECTLSVWPVWHLF